MRLARISSRVSSSGESRSTSSSNVRLGSSVIAHSSPLISTPAAGEARRIDERAGRCPSSSRPSASASRSAGSIVTTATRAPSRREAHRDRGRGRRLADAARAGADHDALALEALAERAHRTRSRSPGELARSTPRRARAGTGRAARPPGSRARAAVAPAVRAAARARAWRPRAASTTRSPARPSSAAASAALKRRGLTRLATASESSRPVRSASARSSCERLVDRQLLRPRDGDHGGALGIADERVDRRRLARDAADARRAGERRAAPSSTAIPWPLAGASRITRS